MREEELPKELQAIAPAARQGFINQKSAERVKIQSEIKKLNEEREKYIATKAAHSAPGVGLGLTLSRRLARELGGRLEYLPSQERGACFGLTLPRL